MLGAKIETWNSGIMLDCSCIVIWSFDVVFWTSNSYMNCHVELASIGSFYSTVYLYICISVYLYTFSFNNASPRLRLCVSVILSVEGWEILSAERIKQYLLIGHHCAFIVEYQSPPQPWLCLCVGVTVKRHGSWTRIEWWCPGLILQIPTGMRLHCLHCCKESCHDLLMDHECYLHKSVAFCRKHDGKSQAILFAGDTGVACQRCNDIWYMNLTADDKSLDLKSQPNENPVSTKVTSEHEFWRRLETSGAEPSSRSNCATVLKGDILVTYGGWDAAGESDLDARQNLWEAFLGML